MIYRCQRKITVAITMKQINLVAEETPLERLGKLGDSLERLKIIDFESFRLILTDALKSLSGLIDETVCRI